MANINLLPWREEVREQAKREYLGVLVFTALISGLLVYLFLFAVNSMISNQQARNQYLRDEITFLDKQIAEIQTIKQRKADIEKRTDIILTLQQQRNLPTYVMDELARIVPSGIYLSKLERDDESLLIHGRSESNNNVANMMRKVTTSPWLQEPNMKSIVAKKEEVRQLQEFELDILIIDEPTDSLAQGQNGARQ